MTDISFSIVIPLYNKGQHIIDTINSVLNQTYTNYEIIVVNDGSTDNSLEKLSTITDKRIKIINKENGGVCSARNTGIQASLNDYIAFLDADDIWLPTCLEEQARLINDYSNAAIWGVGFIEMANNKQTRYLPTGLSEGYRGVVPNYFQMKNRVSDLYCSSSTVVLKKAFETTGLFDTRIRIAEDCDMWFRLIARFPAIYYDKTLVIYRQDATNRASNENKDFTQCLAYYPEKYVSYKDNKIFYHYIQNWCAVSIKQHYFRYKKDRAIARAAAKKLDYSVLPHKYKYIFNTPYFIGKAIEWLSIMRKHFKKTPKK